MEFRLRRGVGLRAEDALVAAALPRRRLVRRDVPQPSTPKASFRPAPLRRRPFPPPPQVCCVARKQAGRSQACPHVGARVAPRRLEKELLRKKGRPLSKGHPDVSFGEVHGEKLHMAFHFAKHLVTSARIVARRPRASKHERPCADGISLFIACQKTNTLTVSQSRSRRLRGD